MAALVLAGLAWPQAAHSQSEKVDCDSMRISDRPNDAASAATRKSCSVLTFVFENDFFGVTQTDNNYTTGLKIHYRAPVSGDDGWARIFARDWLGASPSDTVFSTWAAGINIYTPDDTDATLPLPGQHPYAGWTYGEVGVHIESLGAMEGDTKRHDFLASYTLDVGVVGPSSWADELQMGFHDIIGQDGPFGWDNQIEDEFGVMLTGEFRWRYRLADCNDLGGSLLNLQVDTIPMTGFSAGNVITEGQAGVQLRVGGSFSGECSPNGSGRSLIERDWGGVRVRPGNGSSGGPNEGTGWSWLFWGGVQSRVQIQNIFLDGNTWKDSLSVDKNPLVADLEAGLVINGENWGRFSAFYVYRTEEFELQTSAQHFGGVTLSFFH
jgi:hypothetical protein